MECKKRRKTSVETRYPKNKSPNFSEDSIHWSLKFSLLSSSELFERQKRPLEVHISGTFRWLYLHLDSTTSITTPDKYPILKRNTEQFENPPKKKTHSAFKKKNIILDHKLTKNHTLFWNTHMTFREGCSIITSSKTLPPKAIINPPALRLLSVVACGGALGNGSGARSGKPECLGVKFANGMFFFVFPRVL